MNGYELTRAWFDFSFENPDLITPSDTALYMWIIEKNNRCGWSEKLSISSSECMAACGFKTYPPYKKSFDKLVDLGFVTIIKKSQNQFQCNVIALSKIDKAPNKALEKALLKHSTKHVESIQQSTSESTFDINKTNKPQTNKPITSNLELVSTTEKEEKVKRFSKPPPDEVKLYFIEKNSNVVQAEKFYNHYEANGWMIGKNKMKDWAAAARNWILNENKYKQNGYYSKAFAGAGRDKDASSDEATDF